MKVDYLTRYRNYLESDHWARLKIEATNRWGGSCFICGKNPVDIHHLSYRNLIDCSSDDVIPLCRRCHRGAHFKGGEFRKIKALPSNHEKRLALRALIVGVLQRYANACSEAPRINEAFLVRTGKRALMDAQKARLDAKREMLSPQQKLSILEKNLSRAIRRNMSGKIITRRTNKLRKFKLYLGLPC